MDYRYDFSNNKEKNKKKIIFIIIFSIFVIMFVAFFFRNSSNGVVASISGIVAKPITFVYESFNNLFNNISKKFGDIEQVQQENEQLKQENENLKLQILESQKILDENTTLKEMLNIQKEYQHFELVMGNIIYREHDNWTQTFKIDIGENDGIKLNQAVVHKDGLVGYISSVEKDTSTVTTILDPSSSVSVSISTVNEPAILKGDLNLKSQNRLTLDFIPLDANISIADMLYTSGLGATYPASIPVGKIIEVINNKNDMNRYAIVEPNVNIRTISEVGVIID